MTTKQFVLGLVEIAAAFLALCVIGRIESGEHFNQAFWLIPCAGALIICHKMGNNDK